MKKLLAYSLLATFVAYGCQVKEVIENTQESQPEAKVFTAVIEDNTSGDTKTSLDGEGNVLWKQGDQVSIFAGSTVNEQYQVSDASDGKTAATLNKVDGGGFVAGTEIDNNVAFYPYASTAEIAKSGSNYVISEIELPATQNYAAGSFGNGAFPMAAVTSSTGDMNLKFKNILGGLKLQLKGTATITSITVTGNNNEILCGDAEVTTTYGGVPSITLSDVSAKTVTLNCGAGVTLDSETATPFIIALPPMTMTGGFTVTVTDSESKHMEISTSKSQTIVRSKLLKMPTVTYEGTSSVDPSIPAMALSGIFSVGVNKQVHFSRGNLQYTRGTTSNNGTWGFAEKQYDIVGDTDSNKYLDTSEGSKVDLFCWSGDSYSNYGLSTQTASGYYDGHFLDWGRKIDNDDTWRTLSAEEWSYLLGTTAERNGKYRNWVTVNGIRGLIIAPDNFTGTILESYDASSWALAENDGLVFLPISGYRYENYVSSFSTLGGYWSSTTSSRYSTGASRVFINSSNFGIESSSLRRYAYCVRLVNDITSPTAVDLGLSVKWASCNVGARNPFGLGHYFAWGETKGYDEEDLTNSRNYEYWNSYVKQSFRGETYKYCTGSYPSYTMTKYVSGGDNLTVLQPIDDPATANWGEGWRTPTIAELEELLDPSNCSWTWYGPTTSATGGTGVPEFNGVIGYKVQSLKPGFTDNYIFLPASGYRSSNSEPYYPYKNALLELYTSGNYWASSIYTESDCYAYYLKLNNSDYSAAHWRERWYGFTVRPVSNQ